MPLDALLTNDGLAEGERCLLGAPRVGVFRATVQVGDLVWPGKVVGRLTVLGRAVPVLAPSDAAGLVLSLAGRDVPRGYGQELLRLGEAGDAGAVGVAAGKTAVDTDGSYAVRAPINGIFYARPTPSAPAYVSVGDVVVTGQTLGLVEVMKTFNPVSLGGPGAPTRGRVIELLAKDGDEVAAGAVLVRVAGE